MFSRPIMEGHHNLQNVGPETPMFSRPTMLGGSCLQNVGELEPLLPVPKEPCYARPGRTDPGAQYKKTNFDSAAEGNRYY